MTRCCLRAMSRCVSAIRASISRRDADCGPKCIVGTRQAFAKRALGRRSRYRGQPYAGKRLRIDASQWAVAACGLAQGGDFPGTVMPFILRGVAPYGVNSVLVENDTRAAAWDLLKRYVSAERFAAMTEQIGLGDVIDHASQVLSGNVRGRTVVDVNR